MVSGLHFRRFIRDSWDTCTVRRMGTKCGPDFVEWGPVEDLTTCTFKSYLNSEKLFFTSRGFINAEVEWHHCTVSFQIDYLLESMRKVLLFRFHSCFYFFLMGVKLFYFSTGLNWSRCSHSLLAGSIPFQLLTIGEPLCPLGTYYF